MLKLCDNPVDTLTQGVWDGWKTNGVKTKLTWLEVHKIAEHFLKICRDQDQDYQAHDFSMIVDSNLNYYENLSEIENTLNGTTEAIEEQEALGELNDKLQDDYGITVTKSLKPTTELEQKNKELAATNRRLEAMLRNAEEQAKKPTVPIPKPLEPAQIQQQKQETILYTPEELAEIIEYLQHKKPTQQPKQFKKKLSATATSARNVLELAAWMIHH
jgi:hypothetical protein